jgi:hypothetical protein
MLSLALLLLPLAAAQDLGRNLDTIDAIHSAHVGYFSRITTERYSVLQGTFVTRARAILAENLPYFAEAPGLYQAAVNTHHRLASPLHDRLVAEYVTAANAQLLTYKELQVTPLLHPRLLARYRLQAADLLNEHKDSYEETTNWVYSEQLHALQESMDRLAEGFKK